MKTITCLLLYALFVSFTVGFCKSVHADTLTGTVSSVHDGDTLTLKTDDARIVDVRLVEIDAPELAQPYGAESRDKVSAWCLQQPAIVETTGADRYGRTLGYVWCNGLDVNFTLVYEGLAWFFVKYGSDINIKRAEYDAQNHVRGLWHQDTPKSPWDFRAEKKKNR